MFFNVSKTQPPEENSFFNFLDGKSELDLSTLIPIDFSLKEYVTGYVGTNTVPNCERGVCWYILRNVHSIGPDQLEKLKVKDVKANNRVTSQPVKNYKQYDAAGLLYTPPSADL